MQTNLKKLGAPHTVTFGRVRLWIIGITVLAVLLLSLVARAQTNEWYRPGDMTLGLGPEVSLARPFNGHTFGYGAALDYTYWQTASTGTGLEIGATDLGKADSAGIDHTTALEKLRLTPWPTQQVLNRLELFGETGAETWYDTGAKGVLLGGGMEVALTPSCRLDLELREHFETTATHSGESFFLGLEIKF